MTTPESPDSERRPPSRWDCLPRWTGQCRKLRYSARREGIGLTNAIVEGYDDLARVRTEDARSAVLEITVPADYEAELRALIGALPAQLEVKEIPST